MRGDGRGQVNNGLALSQWPAVHMARIFIFFLSSSSENKLRRMGGEGKGGVGGGGEGRGGGLVRGCLRSCILHTDKIICNHSVN